MRCKGLPFNEINETSDLRLEDEMKQRSQRDTVPQFFINGVHVGGGDDLLGANISGLLDSLLEGDIEDASL